MMNLLILMKQLKRKRLSKKIFMCLYGLFILVVLIIKISVLIPISLPGKPIFIVRILNNYTQSNIYNVRGLIYYKRYYIY